MALKGANPAVRRYSSGTDSARRLAIVEEITVLRQGTLTGAGPGASVPLERLLPSLPMREASLVLCHRADGDESIELAPHIVVAFERPLREVSPTTEVIGRAMPGAA